MRRRARRKFQGAGGSTQEIGEEQDGEKSGVGFGKAVTIVILCGLAAFLFFTPMQAICDDVNPSPLLHIPLIAGVCFHYNSKALGIRAEYLLSRGHREAARQIFIQMSEKGMIPSPLQRPRWGIPHLKSRGWWDIDDLSWGQQSAVRLLEKNAKSIWREARAPLSERLTARDLDPNDNHDRLVAKGQWSIMRLYFRGQKNESTCASVPQTCALIDEIATTMAPLSEVGQVKFSVLPPGAHVLPHTGPSNLRLRLHLTLRTTGDQYQLRIANESRSWRQGRAFVIDDSFEHEITSTAPVLNGPPNIDKYRTVLIVDFCHPDLRPEDMQRAFPSRKAMRWH